MTQAHKHIPEMFKYTGLAATNHSSSHRSVLSQWDAQVPLHASLLKGRGPDVLEVLNARYENEPFVQVMPPLAVGAISEKSFDPLACNNTNLLQIHVVTHPSGHVILMAILDNLGKGASGMAIQNLNLMLGIEETTGLPV